MPFSTSDTQLNVTKLVSNPQGYLLGKKYELEKHCLILRHKKKLAL